MVRAVAGNKAPSEGRAISGGWLSLVDSDHPDVQIKLVFVVVARLDGS
jgi:hypothetical protein